MGELRRAPGENRPGKWQTASVTSTQAAESWRSWKGLLALLSLLLCALLWLNGLLESLSRPSVASALDLRQQELAVLAEPALAPPLRRTLLGADPHDALRQQLASRAAAAAAPLPPSETFTWGLLEQRAGHRDLARQILSGLQGGEIPAPARSPLQRRLVCELAAGPQLACEPAGVARDALRRLLLLTLVPALLLLLGVALLLRQLWMLGRRKPIAVAALQGPDLSLLEVTLVVAGGFVVLGELLTPLLLAPLLQGLLAPLAPQPALQQALSVLLLYGVLMFSPLLILVLLLRHRQPPSGGWLQWQWRPLGTSLGRALVQLLMVLPLVALAGWLLQRVWSDPGGSNPLLDIVLNSSSPVALALLATTALVLAPLFEETLFRGVLLPVLARQWGGGWAVVLSALFFALAHLSLGELVPLFVLGLGLGWLRLQSGRLGACALMHSLWNALTFANLVLLAG